MAGRIIVTTRKVVINAWGYRKKTIKEDILVNKIRKELKKQKRTWKEIHWQEAIYRPLTFYEKQPVIINDGMFHPDYPNSEMVEFIYD